MELRKILRIRQMNCAIIVIKQTILMRRYMLKQYRISALDIT
jgi:hypothetical protein